MQSFPLPARLPAFLVRPVAASALVASAIAVGTLTAPASDAAPRSSAKDTPYSLVGTAYGTRVTSDAGLASGRSAFARIACTQQAGRSHQAELAGLGVPSDSPVVQVGTVTSTTRTFAAKRRGIAAGVESVNRIGTVRLGGAGTPLLSFKGLRTTSRAWATTDGTFRTRNDFSAGTIELTGLEEAPRGPLKDLVKALTGGIDEVLEAVTRNGGTIVIPGLGEVSVGYDKQVRRARTAFAGAFVLRVKLYATPVSDELQVGLGRSFARISRGQPVGVLKGLGSGASGQVLDGALAVGGVGEAPMPCHGTAGKVQSSPLAGIDTAGLAPGLGLGLGTVRGRVFGDLRADGSARAWTEGSVASVAVGGLEITGITGRVNLVQDRRGRIVRNGFKGSSIGRLTYNGTPYGSFDPATAHRIPPLVVDGVAEIEFFQRDKSRRGSRISAVVITLLDGTAAGSEIRLGNARASITR